MAFYVLGMANQKGLVFMLNIISDRHYKATYSDGYEQNMLGCMLTRMLVDGNKIVSWELLEDDS